MKFTIIELQNRMDQREGVKVDCKNLTAAKRKATIDQVFKGTILVIENELGEIVARKERDGKWLDDSYLA